MAGEFQLSYTAQQVQKSLEQAGQAKTDIDNHKKDTVSHVTNTEKQSWNNKADKKTTLQGYGITDGVTKDELREALQESNGSQGGIKNLYFNTMDQLVNWIYTDETMTERMSRDEVVQRCLNGGRLVMVMEGAIFAVMPFSAMALESPNFALLTVSYNGEDIYFASSEYVMGD